MIDVFQGTRSKIPITSKEAEYWNQMSDRQRNHLGFKINLVIVPYKPQTRCYHVQMDSTTLASCFWVWADTALWCWWMRQARNESDRARKTSKIPQKHSEGEESQPSSDRWGRFSQNSCMDVPQRECFVSLGFRANQNAPLAVDKIKKEGRNKCQNKFMHRVTFQMLHGPAKLSSTKMNGKGKEKKNL